MSDEGAAKKHWGTLTKRNYNVTPSQTIPVIIQDSSVQIPIQMKWGIHRQIGKDLEKDIINTRGDKALSRFWSRTVRTHRCLVPANGFYEWKTVGNEKIPYWIHVKGRPLFVFAGIWSENEYGRTFSIMTTTPNKEMSVIHQRMPVILTKEREDAWLFADKDEMIEELLSPLSDNSLAMYRVSKDVNNPRNNYRDLIKPVPL